jgi:hypothetical protein
MMNKDDAEKNSSSPRLEFPHSAPERIDSVAVDASSKSPRCPKCGFVMCEQFDTQRINERAELATPNGTYICYGCNVQYHGSVAENDLV